MSENDFYCEEVFSGKTKVDVLKESPKVIAFYHTKPAYELHVVIVPKQHVRSLVELQDMDLVKEIFEFAKVLIEHFELEETNFRVITNGGSYQDSKHLHFHLVSGAKVNI